MADFPTSIHTPTVTSGLKATVAGTATNDATYDHTQDHVDYGEEIVAAQTKVGTGSSTPVANAVLIGNGTGTSTWDTTPTVVSLTATGALTAASAALTGALTSATSDITTSMALNSDLALVANGDGNFEIRFGGAAGTISEIWVPTTGDIQAAIDDLTSGGLVKLLPGTHTPSAELTITVAGVSIVGANTHNTIISASSFSVANQSIINITDVDHSNLSKFRMEMGSNSDKCIELVASSSGASGTYITDIIMANVNTGRTGLHLDNTAASHFNLFVRGLRIGGSGGTGIDANGLQRSFLQAHIDVNAGTHWDLDSSSDKNICEFIVNAAGTDNGAGNSVTEVVF